MSQTYYIPEPKFACNKCGAEWDSRRGNKTTKAGDTCKAVHGFEPPFTICDGTLRVVGTPRQNPPPGIPSLGPCLFGLCVAAAASRGKT
jgi:hypothetical protein